MSDMSRDGVILFTTRFIRLFSYGFLSVGLLLYLSEMDYTQFGIGSLFTMTLIGDLLITFYLTTTADSYGRKTILILGALLKIFAGMAFACTSNFILLCIAGTIGVISPTGGEIGPFLAVEQAALTEAISDPTQITTVFAYYNLAGYLAQALGALGSGYMIMSLQSSGYSALTSYRTVLFGYAFFGLIKFILYLFLSSRIEPLHTRDAQAPRDWFGKFGLHRAESRQVVTKLSLLFIIDAFAGGFVMQTIIVYWFNQRWQMNTDSLGLMMRGANILAGVSALLASPLVNLIGAINTMVVTHFPSNILLLIVPFMPTQLTAVGTLLARFTISQMDVPARQSYVASVVEPDERSAAGGITNIVRSLGLAVSPITRRIHTRCARTVIYLWFTVRYCRRAQVSL